MVRVRLLVVTVLLDLLLEQAHRVPSRRLEEPFRPTRILVPSLSAKYYVCRLQSICLKLHFKQKFY